MLILSRRPGDAIVIDGGIRIVILEADARGVRIGIEAPPSVGIVREELLTEIAAENRRAAGVRSPTIPVRPPPAAAPEQP